MRGREPGTVAWIVLAVAGLLVAVAVAYAASRLASPHVGLSGEPVSAGARLAPAERAQPRPSPRPAPSHDGDDHGGADD